MSTWHAPDGFDSALLLPAVLYLILTMVLSVHVSLYKDSVEKEGVKTAQDNPLKVGSQSHL